MPTSLRGPRVLRDGSASTASKSGPGRAGSYGDATRLGATNAAATPRAGATHATAASTSVGTHKNGLFGSPVTGTEALFALLAADWALLVAVLTWHFSRRWLRRAQFA